ncbi:hypothetical protein [Bosea sp. (in: a-proteobacteria)]|uniref:hypothetical protein n=1 Tax=Bosea sp. (in: a-proteobacteria) TaxID=1871050 RepID=UPI001AC77E77|nr:hypothetical protein [Bosea sp. (in: a-proteobacteria)]MBN9441143.1 hypothetical protein [Bosea sp. (in: a-proteobacteria)]
MTDQDFNLVSGYLASEVQKTLANHFDLGISVAQADAIVSSLAFVVAMYAAQDPKTRVVFDKVLDHSIEMISGSQRFQQSTAELRSGGTPERGLGLDIPNIAPIVAAVRSATNGPDTCLACAIGEVIRRRLGDAPRGAQADTAVRAMAGAVANLAADAGVEIVTPFVGHLNDLLAQLVEQQSTDGMIKQ